MLAHNDWRYQFAGIMSISQVGEYIENPDDIVPVVATLENFLSN